MAKQEKKLTKPEKPIGSTVSPQSVPESDSPVPKVDGLAAAPSPATPSIPSSPVETPKDKLILTLDDRGGIDLGSMRTKSREKLLAALRKSESDLFPKAPEGGSSLSIPDAAISAIYNLIGVGETMLASHKFPPTVAAQAFMWTPEEIALIRDPSKALIGKYAYKLRGFEEEATWALVFVQIHFGKMHVLRQLMAEHTAAVLRSKEAQTKTPGPKPGDSNGGLPGDISPGDSPVPKVEVN